MNDSDTLKPAQNTGVLEAMPRPTDWIADVETGVQMRGVGGMGGDWRSMLPTDEKQIDVVNGVLILETNACVSFSADNVLEIYGDYEISIGAWDGASVQWLHDNGYFDANGKLNFSDRFTAKMSGTSPVNGNYLQAVWDSIRNNGMVPESAWPMPYDELAADYQVNAGGANRQAIYYKDIPADIIAKGKEFAKRFEVKYDWVKFPGHGDINTLLQNLETSPLQIATAVCNGWNTANPIPACGPGGQHATTLVNIEPSDVVDIYDHYNPFLKRMASDYDITYAVRATIAPRAPTPAPAPVTHNFLIPIKLGDNSEEVLILQKALQADGTFPANVIPNGNYGQITRKAVYDFQVKYMVAPLSELNSLQGTLVGPKTRAQLNKLFNK